MEKDTMKVNNRGTFLSLKDLVVEYTSEGQIVHAVNGVSLELEKGKTLALVGETGAGKTTIAKAILQVLPDVSARITSGQVILEGENLLSLSKSAMYKVRGRRISMIFQDPMTALNPTMRIGKQIQEVIEAHNKISKSEAEKRAKEMLETVGIPAERFREYPHQFSGGMKQRVVIAIALACNPDLLLADEPTTALDVTIQAQVLEMINRLKEERQTSMILITHDLGVVAETSDHVAVVYAGEIIESGTTRDILKRPKHPYTMGLIGALPNMNEDADRLSPISGMPPDPTNLPSGCAFHPRCAYATEKCRQQKMEMMEVEPGHFCRCCRDINATSLEG